MFPIVGDEDVEVSSVDVDILNTAVTHLEEIIDTVHIEDVPEQAPDQPANTDPDFGVAVRVVLVPLPNNSLQSVPHEIPVPVTNPVPVPAFATDRLY